jgi:hypothetical protein
MRAPTATCARRNHHRLAGTDNSRPLALADEREHVFFVVEVIYKIIPVFYEEISCAGSVWTGSAGDRSPGAHSFRFVGGRRHG